MSYIAAYDYSSFRIMKRLLVSLLLMSFMSVTACAQTQDDFSVELVPVNIDGLPGLQSYAFAQHDGKWLVIGGRTEGIHARQGHSSFPAANNNTNIYVIDVRAKQVWSLPVDSLAVSVREQLQSTNMQFYQDGERLVLTGGYAFSRGENRHMTYPCLSVIDVPEVIEAIIAGESVTGHVVQIEDEAFALTGGQLGMINGVFHLVGGHRFDGRYNPHGPDHGMGFKQEYSSEIRRFRLTAQGDNAYLVEHLPAFRDDVHLRRRDFNLLQHVDPNGSERLVMSAGVFRPDADLPILNPVEISADGYKPVEGFSQLLSNYHSAKASFYSRSSNTMHHVFFGGISQHYFDGGDMVRDDQIPFVKTISRLTRHSDGKWSEVALPVEMPEYDGAGAEFISAGGPDERVIDLDSVSKDGTLIGYVYGGISSPMKHAFFNYETSKTKASSVIYEVKLIQSSSAKNIKAEMD